MPEEELLCPLDVYLPVIALHSNKVASDNVTEISISQNPANSNDNTDKSSFESILDTQSGAFLSTDPKLAFETSAPCNLPQSSSISHDSTKPMFPNATLSKNAETQPTGFVVSSDGELLSQNKMAKENEKLVQTVPRNASKAGHADLVSYEIIAKYSIATEFHVLQNIPLDF